MIRKPINISFLITKYIQLLSFIIILTTIKTSLDISWKTIFSTVKYTSTFIALIFFVLFVATYILLNFMDSFLKIAIHNITTVEFNQISEFWARVNEVSKNYLVISCIPIIVTVLIEFFIK